MKTDAMAPLEGASRILAQYDVLAASVQPPATQSFGAATSLLGTNSATVDDPFGHGTHVTSIIASSAVATTGQFQGVAPGVNLVSVRALDAHGSGR